MTVKFAVLGTGDVGRELAIGLHTHGHDVVVGTRDPAKRPDWLANDSPIELATFAKAAANAEALVLAFSWKAVDPILAAVHEYAEGKLVIDATNPLKFDGEGPPGLAVSGEDSAGERIQSAMPHSRVVKCWNIVGHQHMINPLLADAPTMFIAGDDRVAKEDVRALLGELGWPDVADLGGIEASRYLEAMCMAWVRISILSGSGDHAFKLVRASV